MNKSLLDTDIYSEVLKAVDTNLNQNAVIYRKQHGFYTVSVVTLMEIVQGFQRTRSDAVSKHFYPRSLRKKSSFLMKPTPSYLDAS